MITLTGEYALRAVVCLAAHHGEPMTAEAISQHTAVSVGYLAKILQGLNRSGLVASQRGPHGGFTLRHRAEDITVYDVVEAADQLPRLHEGPDGAVAPSPNKVLDRLHRLLSHVRGQLEEVYRTTTIAALMVETGSPDQSGPAAVRP